LKSYIHKYDTHFICYCPIYIGQNSQSDAQMPLITNVMLERHKFQISHHCTVNIYSVSIVTSFRSKYFWLRL